MNKVTLTIAKKTYNLKTNEDEQYLLNLAKILNYQIETIKNKQPSIALVDACIFAGLDILSEKDNLQTTCDNLRKQVSDYFNEAKKMEFDLEKAKAEIEKLKNQLDTLNQNTLIYKSKLQQNDIKATKQTDLNKAIEE